MIVVFRYHHERRRVEYSHPMNWHEPEGGNIPIPIALESMQRLYGRENVTVEIYHPHIHRRQGRP